MSQTARIESWTALANDALSLVADLAASGCQLNSSLRLKMAAARGQARGRDYTRLPYPAWEEGKDFLWLLSRITDEYATVEIRLQILDELRDIAGVLIQILATSAHRPRADLDG